MGNTICCNDYCDRAAFCKGRCQRCYEYRRRCGRDRPADTKPRGGGGQFAAVDIADLRRRYEEGATQAELAALVGCVQQTISGWVRGEPDLDALSAGTGAGEVAG